MGGRDGLRGWRERGWGREDRDWGTREAKGRLRGRETGPHFLIFPVFGFCLNTLPVCVCERESVCVCVCVCCLNTLPMLTSQTRHGYGEQDGGIVGDS